MAAATGSSSHPPQQHDDGADLQNQDPNPTELQEAEQPQPQQPPHSETLETTDITNPLQSPLLHQNPQQSDKGENPILIPDEKDQQLLQNKDHQSGATHSTLPEPIILADDAKNTSQPPLSSPSNPQRRLNKRKKPASRIMKRKKSTKKVQNLTGIINPMPFIPQKKLDFRKYEDVLMRLGLYEFSKIELDHSIRSDLLAALIVNYDPKRRCSYVNDYRINVNRADLARALKLPASKSEKVSSSIEEVDLDSEVFSDDAIVFIEDFVSNWMLLHEDSWDMPTDISNWTRCIKDGHPEKMDSASLIWYMVEKELTQGDKLVNCYYASHLQYLIRSQRDYVFEEADDGVLDDGVADDGEENVKAEDEKEEKYGVADDVEEIVKVEDEKEEKYVVADDGEENVKVDEEKGEKDGVADNGEEVVKAEEEKEQEEVKKEKAEKEEEVSVVQEHDIELNLGPEVEEALHEEEVKEDDEVMVEADEHKEDEDEVEEQGGWLLDGKNEFGEHFLQRCQSSDLNTYGERRPEEVEDERIEQVEDEEEEEEEGGERGEEGFDMEANDDALDRDGLTDNFLQGVETHIPFGSQGELRRMSSMDLFGTRDGSFMSHGGPSFFGNGGKRVMEAEEDMHHLDRNSKRLKTDEMWDQKPSDFGMCMDQIQQLVEHAKMTYMSKEQSYENSQYSQQLAINELQDQRNIMDMIIKSKDEELQKKNAEVFRLERELYLMGDLVTGYRNALQDTRYKFAEYRKRYAVREEPLYKDAGPGGLVLSTRELEKLRLKQEEDDARLQMMAQNLEHEYAYKFQMYEDTVLRMADKLVSIENEMKRLKKERSTRRKEIQKPQDEQELSAQPEESKKLLAKQNLPAEPEEDAMPLDEPNLSTEPGEIQKSLDEQNLPAEPEENQMPLDKPNLPAKPEESQKSLDEQNLPADAEENQMPLEEPNLSAEPEAGQKSLDNQNLPAEPEANQKSSSEQELSAEPGANPSSQDDVPQKAAIAESDPPDADESEEKRGSKD